MLTKCHFILYVKDQNASTAFYSKVFQQQPHLDVPGMTEFKLFSNTVLGLMPESGIVRLLGKKLPDPSAAWGIPRSELYLLVDDPLSYHQRALGAGAENVSDLAIRDWGHVAAYCLDQDGHVLVFAKAI
jgi:catechol 2,3-dioxygenase-like lactoylglutathione lyase family enzyme